MSCNLSQPLAGAFHLLVPTFETGFGGSSIPSGIPKLRKLCSTSSTRRSHEDIFLCRSQPTSPGIYSALCRPDGRVDRHVRCTRSQRCRSRSCLTNAAGLRSTPLDLGLAVGPTDWDGPFHCQFLDLFGSESLPTKWE